MIFRVQLHRASLADAAITIEARDEAEAREIAEQRARAGLVRWEEQGDTLRASTEET